MRRPGAGLATLTLILLLIIGLRTDSDARADTLVADLSQRLIAITTAFVGTDVVLFGTSDPDHDIVVTVLGPRTSQIVRRKAQVAGIWINRERLAFDQVPSFYAVASSGPLETVALPDVRARLELGTDDLKLKPIDAAGLDIGEMATFEDALVRNKQQQGLFSVKPSPVNFIGPRLFRTTLHFPANVPPGIYQVQVLELRDGQVTDAQRSALVISKIGLEADVFDFAHQQSIFYGLMAVALSATLGWLGGVIFRRG
jgi:uncharacterized protein (TIGR02186 family)